MKKSLGSLKKMSLSRETLRQLDLSALRTAIPGGDTIDNDTRSCFNTCSCQVCPGGTNLTC